jgi:hypothetical protein
MGLGAERRDEKEGKECEEAHGMQKRGTAGMVNCCEADATQNLLLRSMPACQQNPARYTALIV